MMKRSALLFSAVIVGLSTALSLVKVQPDLRTSEKSFQDDHLHLHTKDKIVRRSPAPLRLLQKRAPTRALVSNKVPNGPLAQPISATRLGRKLSTNSGNGKVNIKRVEKAPDYPPAEASGLLYGAGFYEVSTHDRIMPESVEKHHWKDNPEGKIVQGPVSAYIKSSSLLDGSKSSAQGMRKAIASVENSRLSSGCITCKQPGQLPLIIDVTPGSGKVTLHANNANPKLGPIKVTAETNGFGSTEAAASNHPI